MAYHLGGITFDIPALTPESESCSNSHTFAEMKPANGEPILQSKGANLLEFSVTMYFHISFCKPSRQLGKLMEVMESGAVNPFYWDNGEFKGNYVILDVKSKTEKRLPTGELLAATVDVNLKKYSEAQFLHSVQEENATAEKPDPETETNAPVPGAGSEAYSEVEPADIVRQGGESDTPNQIRRQ